MTHLGLDTLQYPIFEANQVLSSNHLNELLRYLDDSDRASRSHLIGTGWLAGAEARMVGTAQRLTEVRLSCGVGITSLGYLAVIEESRLRYAVEYKDPYRKMPESEDGTIVTGYDPFWQGRGANRTQHTLWELLDEEQADLTLSPADKLQAEQRFQAIDPRQHVLLAYVETDQQDIKSCFAEDCTDRGQRMLLNVRVLAMRRNLILTANFDNGRQAAILPQLKLQRITDYSAGPLPVLYGAVFDDMIPRFADALAAARQDLASYFHPDTESWTSQRIEATLTNARNLVADSQIQVFFDYLRDLVSSYNRLAQDGTGLYSRACPDSAAFPRHLLISELNPDRRMPFVRGRHYFTGPAQQAGEQTRIERLRRSYTKLLEMMRRFGPNNLPRNGVRMLPQRRLSHSANVIPYYYRASGAQGLHLKSLWDMPEPDWPVQSTTPAHYRDTGDNPYLSNIDDEGMVRIEGLLGEDAVQAIASIESLQEQYGLSFDILDVYVDGALPPGGSAYANLDERRCAYNQQRTWLLQQLRGLQAVIAKTLDEKGNWAAYLPKAPPPAAALVDAIEAAIVALPKSIEKFDRTVFLDRYLRLTALAARYRHVLAVYLQAVAGAPLRSPGIRQNGIRSGSSYHMLLALLFGELIQVLGALFMTFSTNALVAEADKYAVALRVAREQDPRKFDNFYARHRGIEHIAGTVSGGSLVLFIEAGIIVGDFYLPYLCCCPCPPVLPAVRSAEIYPCYQQRLWEEELLLAKVASFGEAASTLFVATSEQITGGGAEREELFEKKAERLSSGGLRTRVDEAGSTIYITKHNGEEYLALAPAPGASGTLVDFVVGTKAGGVVQHPYWVSVMSPVVIAHDDVAVTIRDKAVPIRILDNDLMASSEVKVSITNPPKRGEVDLVDEKGDIIAWYSPKTKEQGIDSFEYRLICHLPTGKRLVSQARVVVHIVECCDQVTVPDTDEPDEPVVSMVRLPGEVFCAEDKLAYYHFVTVGKPRNIWGPGIGYLNLATGKLDRNRTGRRLSDDEIRELGLERVFIPTAPGLRAGTLTFTYDTTNEAGQTVQERFQVKLYRMSNEFSWKTVGSNFKKLRFTYKYEPDGAPVTYQWYFGDNRLPVTSARPTHTFQAGDHTVTLIVHPTGNDSCRHKIVKTVRVFDPGTLRDWGRVRDVPRRWPPERDDWRPVVVEDNDDVPDWEIYLDDTYKAYDSWHSYKEVLGTSLKSEEVYKLYLENRLDRNIEKESSKILGAVDKIAKADIENADDAKFKELGGMIENPAATVAEFFSGKPEMTAEGEASFKAVLESMELGKKAGVTYSDKFVSNLDEVIAKAESPEARELVSRMRMIAVT